MKKSFSHTPKAWGAMLAATVLIGSSVVPVANAQSWGDILSPLMKDVVLPAAKKGVQSYVKKKAQDKQEDAEKQVEEAQQDTGANWEEPDSTSSDTNWEDPGASAGAEEPAPSEETDWSASSDEPVGDVTEASPPVEEGVAEQVGVSEDMSTDAITTTKYYTLDTTNKIITLKPVTGDASPAIASAMSYLLNRSDKSTTWTMKFMPGTYNIGRQIYAQGLQNVNMVSDRANPAIWKKMSSFSDVNGEFILYVKYGKNISVNGFHFIGKTSFATSKAPVWPDQGVYFASSNGVTIDRNQFYNFGNAAVRVCTAQGDPVKGVNSFNTKVTNNYFKNVYQTSTTTTSWDHGGTANYLFQYNTFENLIGSVKFATRTAGAKNVRILNNWIKNSDHYGFEINAYDGVELAYNKIENVKEFAINIYNNTGIKSPFAWGNYNMHDNTITNAGMGLRYSVEPYSNGYTFVSKNLTLNNNTFNTIKNTTSAAFYVVNGKVDYVKVTTNKFNNIASRKYIQLPSGIQNISITGNLVNGMEYSLAYK